MYVGAVKGSVSEVINWLDMFYLALLVVASLATLVSFTPLVVIPIATIPSVVGYIVERIASRKDKSKANLKTD